MKKVLILAFCISMFGCSKKISLQSDEYFAFGTARGFCAGNCANFYLIKNGQIFPDDMYYYHDSLTFKTTPLSNEKYLLATQLINNFPDYLKNNPNKIIGCPDCADQGRIYIEQKSNGRKYYWHIDTNVESQPGEIKEYISQLKDIVAQLQ